MEEMITQLSGIFAREFPGALVELEGSSSIEKVGGYLIWPGFDGVENLERQRHLSRVLREKLGANYRANVTTILAVTPWEVAVMRES